MLKDEPGSEIGNDESNHHGTRDGTEAQVPDSAGRWLARVPYARGGPRCHLVSRRLSGGPPVQSLMMDRSRGAQPLSRETHDSSLDVLCVLRCVLVVLGPFLCVLRPFCRAGPVLVCARRNPNPTEQAMKRPVPLMLQRL